MKKEYLILILLIILLGAYLFLHKENRDTYTLPDIPEIDTEKISGMIITRGEDIINFDKKEKTWTLTDKAYPADSYMIENILSVFKNFKLSALVSQDGDPGRYALDEKERIHVSLLEGEKPVFEVFIGKTAPSFNHTFVMLAGDGKIYHAAGSFRSNFDNSVQDFRDKKVLSFKQPSIKRLTIEHDTLAKTLVAKEEKNEKDETVVTWAFGNGEPTDGKEVSELLSALSNLECETFMDGNPKDYLTSNSPVFKIHLENDDKIELTLFKKDGSEEITGVSSMNPYLFTLNQYSGKEILTHSEKLLGIYKPEDKEE